MKNVLYKLLSASGRVISNTKTWKCNCWAGGYIHLYYKIFMAKLSSKKVVPFILPPAVGGEAVLHICLNLLLLFFILERGEGKKKDRVRNTDVGEQHQL